MKEVYRLLQGLILAMAPGMAQGSDLNLAIDPAKPYVHIQFDRLGERKPISENEISCGLWLRFSNNSRIPISVRTFDPGTPDPGIGLMHEVVRVVAPVGFGTSPGDRVTTGSAPPVGYEMDVGSRTVIPSGRHLLFGVPADHVDPKWYLRVRFEFEIAQPRSGRQPYSFVEFGWADLPPRVRSSIGMIRGGKCPKQ